jgi:hypothetical protein
MIADSDLKLKIGESRVITLVLFAAALFCRAPAAFAQADAPEPSADWATEAKAGAAKLAQDFNDPLTSLPQIFVQDVYNPANYGTDAQTNGVVARIIVPRIPRYTLLPFVQLIRPSFSVVTVPEGKGSATRTEFGDMGLFDLAVIPWPGEGSGLLLGVGPVFIFPTATDKSAGQNAWQVGPAFAAIYKAIPGVLLGGLIQNPVSFAYTSSAARPLSTLLIQPILLKHLWRGLYVKSADATWAIGERAGTGTTLPVSLGLGYVIPIEGSAPVNVYVTGEWMAYRQNAPFAPQTTVQVGVTVPLPQWTRWKGF